LILGNTEKDSERPSTVRSIEDIAASIVSIGLEGPEGEVALSADEILALNGIVITDMTLRGKGRLFTSSFFIDK